jgi:uncharacterized membrane protein
MSKGVQAVLYRLITTVPGGTLILEWIEFAALAIEVLAVILIIVPIAISTVRYVYRVIRGLVPNTRYRDYKISLARTLLLGLEILVAADIVRTVALEATLESVVVLGLLVIIRTFLSWALVVEMEGRWPWKLDHGVD